MAPRNTPSDSWARSLFGSASRRNVANMPTILPGATRAMTTPRRAVQSSNRQEAAQRAQDKMLRDINASFTPEQRRALANLPAINYGGIPAPVTPPAQTPPQYSPTLPGLTEAEEWNFNMAVRDANMARQRALNTQTEELQRLGVLAPQEENRLRREGYQAGRSIRDELSGSGLGFSPMFINRAMRSIAQDVEAGRAGVRAQRASREEALRRAVQQADENYREILSQIEAERARRRSGRAVGNVGGQ